MNLADLFQHDTDVVRVRAGEPIFRAGDAGTAMYVVLRGSADVLVGATVVETAGVGALLGEMALVDAGPRSATVIARDDCTLAAVDVARFDALIRQTPHFARHVMKVMADRLRRMDQRLVALQRGGEG
jgi:CRP-like cAMP-binding protein